VGRRACPAPTFTLAWAKRDYGKAATESVWARMACAGSETRLRYAMNARAVEEAAARLRELRFEEWGDFVLGALALGLASTAAELRPAWALPFLIGGSAGWVLGMRALWRRWDLVDRLAGERDAYTISEVLAYAARETTMDRRQSFAALIRVIAREPGPALEWRVRAVADDLDGLAAELEDDELVLDPASAIACRRLLSDLAASPLLNPALPAEDLRSRVLQIRSGFGARRLAA
jgi:hypothetical protein